MDLKLLAEALKSGNVPISCELADALKDIKCGTCIYRWRKPECGPWNLKTAACEPIVSIPNIYILSNQTGMSTADIVTLIGVADNILPKF